jgi:hypothetical protein
MSRISTWEDEDPTDGPPLPENYPILHYFAHVGFRVARSEVRLCSPEFPEQCNDPTSLGLINVPFEREILAPIPWDTTAIADATFALVGQIARPNDLVLACLARANAAINFPFDVATAAMQGSLPTLLTEYVAQLTRVIEARYPDTANDGWTYESETFVEADVYVRNDGIADWQYSLVVATLPPSLADTNPLNQGPLDELVSLALRLDIAKLMLSNLAARGVK